MKIFIIGPEGSGKTVLLAMLGRYVATERKDLVLEPVDRVASKYVIDVLGTLENGHWPPSTKQADRPTLQWRFGVRGEPLHEIVIFDAAGQDLRQILLAEKQESRFSIAAKNLIKRCLRQILLAEKQESLTEGQLSIRTQIDAADVLVYLLDLDGFLGSNELSLRDENAWLFKTFLTKPEWGCKRRLVVLSKADIYADLLPTTPGEEIEDGKVREVIKQHLPKNYSLAHLVDEKATVSYLAIASVVTKTNIDPNGKPDRRPKIPLESVGISSLIEALIKNARHLQRNKMVLRAACVLIACVLMACVLMAWYYFRVVDCLRCEGKGTVACGTCGGRGEVNDSRIERKACSGCGGNGIIIIKGIFRDSKYTCTFCSGRGQVTYTTSELRPCKKCKSSGKLTCAACMGKKKVDRW